MTDTNTNQPFEEERIASVEQSDSSPYRGANQYNPSQISEFTDEYGESESIEDDTEWVLSGRISRENEFGDFVFYDLDDRTDTVQIMCRREDTDEYEELSNLNLGDRVVFIGTPGRSNTDELTLYASSFTVSAKALNYIADEYNQFNEQRQITHRTGALSSDDELFNTIQTRFEIQTLVRQYLIQQDYVEFDTPLLHNSPGGAEATPFETHLEALDMDVYLRIAPELYLKRLITAGYRRVFEIGRSFRNEDIDTTHNPEFTMLELYEEYTTYEDMIDIVESLYVYIAEELYDTTEIEYNGSTIDLSEWERLTFEECLEQEIEEPVLEYSRTELENFLSEREINSNQTDSIDELLMEVFEECVEDSLVGPVFITEYPTVSTPLCQTTPTDESRVQRFEAFIQGIEVANAYTELTDPIEQRERLLQQANGQIDEINDEFVEAISYGMPPTAGLGMGIDRLAMILTDSQSIKSVLPFPMSAERR